MYSATTATVPMLRTIIKAGVIALATSLSWTSSAFAGVPESEIGAAAKWIRVNPNWQIDTEDVDMRGDELRFWVIRTATGSEVMSTEDSSASWRGKYRVRCGDFHLRTEGEVNSTYGTYIQPGSWKRITRDSFGWTLASNFCYLTGTPGFTPEPEAYDWQVKIVNLLQNAKKRPKPSNNPMCKNQMYSGNNPHICD